MTLVTAWAVLTDRRAVRGRRGYEVQLVVREGGARLADEGEQRHGVVRPSSASRAVAAATTRSSSAARPGTASEGGGTSAFR